MAFDPNKFLKDEAEQTKSAGFDPAAFISEDKGTSASDSDYQQTLIDAGIKTAEGGAFGLLPYISGGTEALGQAVGVKGLGGPIKDISLDTPAGLDLDKLGQAYERGYQGERQLQKEIQERSPVVSVAANIAGGIATGSALTKAAAPVLAQLPNVSTLLNPVSNLGGNLSKAGSMDFSTLAKAPSILQRTAQTVLDTAPVATAIGFAQPTEEVGLNLGERAQNAALANALNIPLTGTIESIPAIRKAARDTGDFMWGALPSETKSGIKAGLEGFAPFSKKAKQSYEVINNRLVDFFSNKVIPAERKAHLDRINKDNIDIENRINVLNGELKTIQNDLDQSKRFLTDTMMKSLSDSERKILTKNQLLIKNRKVQLDDEIKTLEKQYGENFKNIQSGLDAEYKALKDAQKAEIDSGLKVLEQRNPPEFDTDLQNTILKLKDDLGQGYDAFESELSNKNIKFGVSDALATLKHKLSGIEGTALASDKKNVKALNKSVLNELKNFMGEGSIGYSEYKTLLNGTRDPRTGKRIDSALRDIRTRANGLPVQQKFMKAIDEFEDEVRSRQVDHLNDIGETSLAQHIQDLNKRYKDFKFYENKFLNLSEKAGVDGRPIILKNPETRGRYLEAGKKGFLDEGVTGKGLAGESLIQELESSVNPEISGMSGRVNQFYNDYRALASRRGQETPQMADINSLLQRLNKVQDVGYSDPNDLAQLAKSRPDDKRIADLLTQYNERLAARNAKNIYERQSAFPDHFESPELASMMEQLEDQRNILKYRPENIKEVQQLQEEVAPDISRIRAGIRDAEKERTILNNPQVNDFLDKAIYNDKPLEDLQKDIRNLIISGDGERNMGGLGTDVQVLSNLVGRIKKYANEYETMYNTPLDIDLKNMVDKLDAAEAKLSGSAVISGSKGSIVAGPSAIASLGNTLVHTLAYLTPNKSVQSIAGVAKAGGREVLNRFQKYKAVDTVLKNFNTSIQEMKNADSVKRAATLNSLMQNPEVRQKIGEDELKELFGN